MPRVYLSNDSYPELRHLPLGWARSRLWWRAIARASRHADFWIFAGTQAALLAALLAAGAAVAAATGAEGSARALVRAVFLGAAGALFSYLQVSWGGDMMRSHLRAVSEVARHACPRCGQSLQAHLAAGEGPLRCPECGLQVERALFSPPYRVPRACRAFPPWRR